LSGGFEVSGFFLLGVLGKPHLSKDITVKLNSALVDIFKQYLG